MRLGQRFESARRLSIFLPFAGKTLNQIKVPAHRVGADLLQPVCLRALTTANPDRNSATRGCSRGWRKRDVVGFWTFPAGRNASTMARRVLGCLCGATAQCWEGQTLYPLPPR